MTNRMKFGALMRQVLSQIEVAGRDYACEEDSVRWHWTRQKEGHVLAYLQRIGSFRICGFPRFRPSDLAFTAQ
jgi:hypothetical protein